jgi:hypothetical protein
MEGRGGVPGPRSTGDCMRSVNPTTIFSAAVAIFTLVLALVACLQWHAYVEAERPLLIVEGVSFQQNEPSIPMAPMISIKNAGRSAAVITEVNIIPTFHAQQPGKLLDTPDYHAKSVSVVINPISPGTTVNVIPIMDQIVPHGMPVPPITGQEFVDKIKSGEMPLDIYGFIKYTLRLNPLWDGITGFCFRYSPMAVRNNRQFQFTVCDNPAYTYAQ